MTVGAAVISMILCTNWLSLPVAEPQRCYIQSSNNIYGECGKLLGPTYTFWISASLRRATERILSLVKSFTVECYVAWK